jgi:hypothetical protein
VDPPALGVGGEWPHLDNLVAGGQWVTHDDALGELADGVDEVVVQ